MTSPSRPIPFTVIGGYLGAGKTTLVNEILRDPRGTRYGVIVNDVGEVNIDASLIESVDGDTLTLSNGCICCSIADGFAEAMAELRTSALDHVVVEVSGVGDPWKVAQWGRTPGFELDAVITLADVESVGQRAADPYVGETVMMQLRSADLVVLTHVDVADAAQVEAVAEWASSVTDAPVLAPRPGARAVTELLRSAEPGAGRPTDTAHAHHEVRHIDAAVEGDRGEWLSWLTDAPPGVVRIKGFVDVGDDVLLLQRAGQRSEVRRWSHGDVPREIVVIATPGVDRERLDVWCARPGGH